MNGLFERAFSQTVATMNGAANKKVESQTMEDILSSIRRIMTEDQRDVPTVHEAPPILPPEPTPVQETGLETDILALRTALNAIRGEMEGIRGDDAVSFSTMESDLAPEEGEEKLEEALLSLKAGDAVRQSLDELSRVVDAPHREFDIEAAAKAMLRPMLSEWLDEHLPSLVERLVRQEIARITGGGK